MINVLHFTDDSNPDSVTGTIDALMHRLDRRFMQARLHVAPETDLPAALPAKILIVHFAISWRKLAWLHGLRARNPRAVLILAEHSFSRAFENMLVPNRIRFRAMLRLACGLMDRVVTVSKEQGDWLWEVACLPREKLLSINPHADLAPLRRLPPPERLLGPLRLCAFGRYAWQSGFDTLIDAMKLVSPDTATLRLAGIGPDDHSLRAQASGLPHVSVEGPVPELDLLASADAAVIPSRFEPFGMAGLAARAAARPVIASAVDGLAGQTEFCVPPENAPALAQAIRELAGRNLRALSAIARASAVGAEQRTIESWDALLWQMAGAGRILVAA
jgi:glycosyltransferase involved in cell wall biosynthesis